MTTFCLPDLGEGLQEAEIITWHVKPGERIKVDEPLVAVETAKAVVEVPSPHSGRVTRLHGDPGEVVEVGAPLAEFEVAGSETATTIPRRPSATCAACTATPPTASNASRTV